MESSDFIYKCLIENLSDGLLVSNPEGFIQMSNQAFANLIGCPAPALIGKPLSQFIHFDEHEMDYDTVFGTNHNGTADNNGNTSESKKGTDISLTPAHSRIAAIMNSSGLELLMPVTHCPLYNNENEAPAVLEIEKGAVERSAATEPCAAERGIARLGKRSETQAALEIEGKTAATQRGEEPCEVERGIARLGERSETQAAPISGYLTIVYIVQADCLQQAQTEFVSTVSHELRTPLTSIKGFADTILRSGDKLDPSQQRRYVGIIKDQADRLTRLVEDLLAVSRLESKKMQLTIRAIDLQEAIERVVRNMTDKIGNHRIVIDVPTGLPHIWADADRLEQILTNLIDNAIKYSSSGTTVTIAAHEHGQDAEMVNFSVTDQGVGIPTEHLSKIFTKFGRLDNPLVRQTEGTGLGLYITHSLVLALGGEIEVESKRGLTTFTVQLPAASLEEQAARGRG